MSAKQIIAPYMSSFYMGYKTSITDRTDYISMTVVYGCLLIIMSSIFKIMPIHELMRPDITAQHFIWYFAMTEIVIVGMQGNHRQFGYMIADGELTTLMRRPGQMMGLLMARFLGNCLVNMLTLLAFAIIALWAIGGTAPPMNFYHLPLLFISLIMGMTLYLTIGYMTSMMEIFGSYSSSMSLVMGKFVFTFGGLFFPVIFFPDIVKKFVFFTPFPSVIFAPAQFMLNPTMHDIVSALAQQVFWLTALISLALYLEKKLVHHVLENGD
jgi:ABC-2 type transport system permease protein